MIYSQFLKTFLLVDLSGADESFEKNALKWDFSIVGQFWLPLQLWILLVWKGAKWLTDFKSFVIHGFCVQCMLIENYVVCNHSMSSAIISCILHSFHVVCNEMEWLQMTCPAFSCFFFQLNFYKCMLLNLILNWFLTYSDQIRN